MFNSSLYFSFFLQTHACIKNAQFYHFYQYMLYMLLLTKVKQFSQLVKHKKEIGVTLLAVISL